MISIIITAYKDPISTKESIERILNQDNFNESFELIVACPDEPTKKVIMDYKKKYPKIIKYVHQDYACPKNQLMNNILEIVKGRILIWTDGNKFFEKNAIKLLLEPFKDEKVGLVGGRIISKNDERNLFGIWANTLAKGLHSMRKDHYKKRKFTEHTSNILAIRGGIIKKIPLDIAEGSVISFLISHKGYKTVYVEDAKVYVNYPESLSKCFWQRARSAKAHMELSRYTKKSNIKYKNYYNQVIFHMIKNTFKEFFQSLLFILFMIYIQLRAFFSLRIRNQHYISVWRFKDKED